MGFRTEIRARHVDVVLKFALDTSIRIAFYKAIPLGKRRLDRASRRDGATAALVHSGALEAALSS